ncbi:hypothetical protein DFJ77DRAFT_123059 [Powellomyces hirtus]|nr:hypothetical protein DFJ77DRAFT_123059 [Powellomyces hirtus]
MEQPSMNEPALADPPQPDSGDPHPSRSPQQQRMSVEMQHPRPIGSRLSTGGGAGGSTGHGSGTQQRISRSSTSSQKKKSWTTASGQQQRFSAYMAVPGVKVRDYAYHTTDARHYGMPLSAIDSSPTSRSNSSDWFSSSSSSSSSAEDKENDREEEDDAASYGSGAERLFESDTESDLHQQHMQQQQQGVTSHMRSPIKNISSSSNNNEAGSTSRRRQRPAEIPHRDMEATVLPHLASLLRQHMGHVDLKFRYAKAMFDFQKATEWEMSLNEGEDLVIAYVEPPSPEPAPREKQTGDKEKEVGMEEQWKENDSTNITGDSTPENQQQQQQQRPQSQTAKSETDTTATTLRGADNSERWASIDCVADELLTIVHGGQQARPDTNSSTTSCSSSSSSSPSPSFSLNSDPPASDLAAQLNQLLDYAGVYGTGWATAVRFKCRGALPPPPPPPPAAAIAIDQQQKKSPHPSPSTPMDVPATAAGTAGKKATPRVKIKLVDMGLVPGNYIETIES